MGLTAKNIGRDWNRLYWNLPFYPARGKQEMAKDINSIDDKYHRGDVFHVCLNLTDDITKSYSLLISILRNSPLAHI